MLKIGLYLAMAMNRNTSIIRPFTFYNMKLTACCRDHSSEANSRSAIQKIVRRL
jgi:hypothetical protein